jgi:hypothetical protein
VIQAIFFGEPVVRFTETLVAIKVADDLAGVHPF